MAGHQILDLGNIGSNPISPARSEGIVKYAGNYITIWLPALFLEKKMKRWIVNGSLALIVFLVAYKHDIVAGALKWIIDLIVAFAKGIGDIVKSL